MVDIQTILSGALSTVAIGCLGVIAKTAGQYGGKIAKEVWAWIECKAKASNLEYVLKEAKVIWYQVEEDWRIDAKIKDAYVEKSKYFDDLILSKFPSLKQSDIDKLRQSIAGAYNEGKKEQMQVLTVDADLQSMTSVKANVDGWLSEADAAKMQAENEQLKADLEAANKKLNGIARELTVGGATE